jgi:hypothetical protein
MYPVRVCPRRPLAAGADIEDRTDATEQAIVAAPRGRLDEACVRLDDRSERCIAAGASPPTSSNAPSAERNADG